MNRASPPGVAHSDPYVCMAPYFTTNVKPNGWFLLIPHNLVPKDVTPRMVAAQVHKL